MQNLIFEKILEQVKQNPKVDTIEILEGVFKIEGDESIYEIKGKLIFTSGGSGRTKISGQIIDFRSKKEHNSPFFASDSTLKFFYCNKEIGEGFRSLYSEKGELGVFADFVFSIGATLIDPEFPEFKKVKFLIPNLLIKQKFQGYKLPFKSLILKLNKIDNPQQTYDSTIKSGAIGFTYWAEVSHKSNRRIDPNQFIDLEKCLYLFFKMLSGNKIPPILYTYFWDEEEVKLETKSRFLEGNKSNRLWSDNYNIDLNKVWECFSIQWIENKYYFKEYIPTLAQWYEEALSGKFGLKTIVAGQICLELLFATVCYEILKLPENRGDFSSASIKFKILLNAIGLRSPYYSEINFKEFKNAMRQISNETDPIDVLTQLRNKVIHFKPPKSKGEKALREAKTIAVSAHLTLWYIEIVFLAIIGYRGSYSSRNHTFPILKEEEFVFKLS